MKDLSNYIVEKLKINKDIKANTINDLSYLVDALKNTLLSNRHTFKEDNFEDWHNGMFTLFGVQMNHEYYDLFLKEIEDIKDSLQFKSDRGGYTEHIGLKEDNTVCISVNFNIDQKIEKADITNIDISKNIKDLLIK